MFGGCACPPGYLVEMREGDAEPGRGVKLRDQVEIGKARLRPEAEGLARDERLDSSKPIADPAGVPGRDLVLRGAETTAQHGQWADIVQRMNVAADQGCHGPHLGPRHEIAR